jgi:hypothetical protein
VEKKLKGRRGGAPMASQVAGGEQVGHVERGNLGARAAARGMSGGGPPARPGAGGREEASHWASPWDRPHPSMK